ncbi:M56 family metallopeptidase [Aquimarina sp. AU58]|uniref:M56 family metallopeptidase n=1 Tax=Aquimarina sp. AU58 TaxID=1874112 RepID=UPI000D64A37F|nr:M56 family metallopeptidase [Aquimarina sp. AU58]
MLYYLLQTVIFQVLFLALYDVFHKKDTFFNWNRLYLIITPLLSLVLPFVKIQAFRNQTSQVYVTKLERVITISSENLVVLGTTGADQNPTNWWMVIYCTGAGLSLLLLILKFYKLKVLKTVSFKANFNSKKIITLPNSNQAFSFWNTIYLGDALSEAEKKQILIHEIVHVEQKHSLDQVWFELLKIVLWWNPIIHIYQSRITILHEYIADATVIATIDKRNYIEQLLNVTFQTQEITFVNQFFNQSLIKKRILMLQKSKSKTIAKFKYLLLIPILAGILVYTSCGEESNQLTNTVENSKSNENSDSSNPSISHEPQCPNQQSLYDKNIDNYLKVRNGKSSEAILDIISTETSEKIRTIHFLKDQTFYIRNIPEGKYTINIIYGDNYAEKTVDGVCIAYFKDEKANEIGEGILDFNILKTEKGINIPSYNLSIDMTKKESELPDESSEESNTTVNGDNYGQAEPKCPNKNSSYDKKLDNYLRITTGNTAEVIVQIVTLDTEKSIRTAYIKRNEVYFIRNIPENEYRLIISYGDNYAEKTVDGVCIAYFKDEKANEIGEDILDFTVIKTDKGNNVPSYNITLDLNDNDPIH